MIKSAIIFIAWICSFKAIKKLPIGFYGIMDMSRVIFATVLGITVLGEVMTGHKIAGMALVLVGLLFVNAKGKGLGEEKTKPIYIVLVLISCLCNAVSELLDKNAYAEYEQRSTSILVYVFYGNIVFGLYDCNQNKNRFQNDIQKLLDTYFERVVCNRR